MERFTQVYNSFIRDPSLSPEAKVLGCVFASYANKRGIAFPGTLRLMQETGMSRFLVTRGRSELVTKGFLRKHFTRGIAGKFARGEKQSAVTFEVSEKILRRPFAEKPGKRRAPTAGESPEAVCSILRKMAEPQYGDSAPS